MKLNTPFLRSLALMLFLCFYGIGDEGFAAEPIFKAGAAKRDITPQEPLPMWGYGERHVQLSNGTDQATLLFRLLQWLSPILPNH